ncbi:MAG: ArgR family transcriptional regulator [Bacteroidales bacterium]|nr:ArgR family transcriptional regulator [Bacteroidales bacterium]
MDKKERQKIIRSIITKEAVQSQEELLSKLASFDVAATQATLSRDLKELGIIKQHTADAGYRYILGESRKNGGKSPSGVLSIEFTACLAVIKTIPGFAAAIASQIDAAPLQEVAGSIAGDDTIILALRTPFKQEQVLQSLSSVLGEIRNKNI